MSKLVFIWSLIAAMLLVPPTTLLAEEHGGREAPLAPRRPDLPSANDAARVSKDAAPENPVDQFVAAYMQRAKISPVAVVDDRTFARRVYLDVIGVLPTPAELQTFLADRQPDKRERLVDTLLADNDRYAQHWMTFWNDALRNDYRGTGYIDGGRKQISTWLYQSLRDNKPYDQFVSELINPSEASEGFIKGIVWRGVVNASQVPEVQAAQNLSQVFLGLNLKCASCHDSFVNSWKLSEAYAFAGIFAQEKLEIHHCDSPTGDLADVGFLYPELGEIDAAAPREQRLKQLAAAMTSDQNGRFTRTMVNRLWARFLGRGLIDPVDEMDHPAWDADLLDWLAVDLVDHDHDLKHTMRRILKSQTYQMPAVGGSDLVGTHFVFSGPQVKRMSAEQFVDAVGTLCGTRYVAAEPVVEAFAKETTTPAGAPAGVRGVFVAADPLMVALGRTNREQVTTDRPSQATTLQALEMTNGATLADWLDKGATHWLAQKDEQGQPLTAAALVERIYQQALGRVPTAEELPEGVAIIGEQPAAAGVQDLLWVMTMLPEFQLVY